MADTSICLFGSVLRHDLSSLKAFTENHCQIASQCLKAPGKGGGGGEGGGEEKAGAMGGVLESTNQTRVVSVVAIDIRSSPDLDWLARPGNELRNPATAVRFFSIR